MERLLRRNFLSILACEVCWGLGMPLALESTVLPMLVLALGGNAFHVGILSALGSAGYLGGLIAPYLFADPSSMRKRVIATYLLAGNGYLLLGLIPLAVLAGWASAWSGLVMVLAVFGLMRFFSMSAAMGYRSVIAQALHREKQLSDWGRIFFLGWIMGVPGGMIAGKLHGLETLAPMMRYGISFLGAFILLQTGNLALVRLRSVRPVTTEGRVRHPWRTVLSNEIFRRFLVGRVLLTSQLALTFFVSVYARTELGLQEGSVALLAAFQLAGVAIGSRVFGYLGQRTTSVHPAAAGAGCVAAGLAIVLVFKEEPALWGAMFLDGMGTASRFLSDYALPLALVGEHRTLPFYSVGTVVYAIPLLVLSPVAGYAVGRFGFAPVALAALLGATLSLAWFVAMLGRVPRTNAQDLS